MNRNWVNEHTRCNTHCASKKKIKYSYHSKEEGLGEASSI